MCIWHHKILNSLTQVKVLCFLCWLACPLMWWNVNIFFVSSSKGQKAKSVGCQTLHPYRPNTIDTESLNMVPGFKKVKLKGRRPKGFTIDSEGHVRRWISRLAAGRGRGRSWKRMTWKNKARPSYISATHLQYPSPDRDVSATKRVERLPAVGQCSASLAWT